MNRIPFYIKNIYAVPEPFDRFHVVVRGENFHLATHTEIKFHIYLMMEGNLDITMGSEKVSISKGQVFIIPPGVEHELYSAKGYFQIGFDVKDVSDPYHIIEKLHEICKNKAVKLQVSHFPAPDYLTVQMLTDMSPLNRLKVISRMNSLLIDIIETAEKKVNPESASMADFRKRFVEVAESCCNHQKSLEEICSIMNFSKTHLERLVKQEFQCSVMEYVNRLRFVRLCSQLVVSDKTLTQLAEENGFYDSAHLCVFFKKYSGMTPAQYRKGKQ